MRPLITLVVAAAVGAGGCHLIYPFAVSDGDSVADLSGLDAALDGRTDGPPALDAGRDDVTIGQEQGVKLDLGADLGPKPDLQPPDQKVLVDSTPVTGKVTTIAGKGLPGCTNSASVQPLNASFTYPVGVAAQGDDLWIADRDCHRIYHIYKENSITVLAGSGQAGMVDGSSLTAQFDGPSSIAAAGQIVYIADTNNHSIRRIDATGFVTTVAGSGANGFKDGAATDAKFNNPVALAHHSGMLYVADRLNCRIRVVDLNKKMVSTLAGRACLSTSKFLDGAVNVARFYWPTGVAVDSMGKTIYVSDSANHRIRLISIAAGVVSTLSGGTPGFLDGKASQARFNDPAQIAVDGTGQVYVADRDNHRIRLISGGIVSTVAGSVTGFLDGPRLKARFSGPVSVALPTANPLEFYVADGANRRIRKVSFK